MDLNAFIIFASAIFSAAMAVVAFLRRSKSLALASFSGAALLIAIQSAIDGLNLIAIDPVRTQDLKFARVIVGALTPGAWIYFSLTYSRGNAREFLKRWRFVLIASLVGPLALIVLFRENVLGSEQAEIHNGLIEWSLRLGWVGVALQAFRLAGYSVALMNLESTFQSATGTMRWRIKYMILGCAVILGSGIYASSQAILFNRINISSLQVQAVARLLGLSLIAFSFLRSRLSETDLYPSHAFLYRTFTAFIVGAYLLIVGVFAKVVQLVGPDENFAFKSLLFMISLVGLAVLLMSDRLRQTIQRLVSRHLRRPVHDYRAVWTLFAERTAALLKREDLCREVARMLSESFNVLSVTVFLVDDQKNTLVFGASTSLPEEKANQLLQTVPNVAHFANGLVKSDPVDMDNCNETWLLELAKLSPDFFHKGGGRVCVPLVASGQFLGLITLTDRVSGVPFSIEDFELLKCIGGQVAANVLNINLSATLLRSKELEAFQTMSTFFVHDLKNTALMLSLMLKNLPVHFNNPQFREDSLRSIAKTVDRINELISRLTMLRKGLEIHPVDSDLNSLVLNCLAPLREAPEIKLSEDFQPLPKVRVDPDQIQKVFTNLFLNAREAVGPDGQIQINTSQTNGWAVVQVTDNGCGISPEFLNRSLFRPFQTTKKKGIGIGMYQSKMIVEAHSGRIEVQSDPGKGATFRVLLPIKTS
jgi:putative PEP-CTERM system histidine kinase